MSKKPCVSRQRGAAVDQLISVRAIISHRPLDVTHKEEVAARGSEVHKQVPVCLLLLQHMAVQCMRKLDRKEELSIQNLIKCQPILNFLTQAVLNYATYT